MGQYGHRRGPVSGEKMIQNGSSTDASYDERPAMKVAHRNSEPKNEPNLHEAGPETKLIETRVTKFGSISEEEQQKLREPTGTVVSGILNLANTIIGHIFQVS